LKETDKKEQFQHLLRITLPNDEIQSVEEVWDTFKTGFVEAEEVSGQNSVRRRYKGTPWWAERI
jgi:hypothetical protein